MTELMQANSQWLKRPADERFLSLDALFDHTANQMENSKALVVPSRSITVQPTDNNTGLTVVGQSGTQFAPTHWAFDQLCQRAGAPAGYMRDLPSPMVADCLNYGFHVNRPIEDIGVLLYQNGGAPELKAVTGPNYGRIWNANIAGKLRELFGNGTDGRWHIPGEFNVKAPITPDNTTLYAGDRDMWAFLCDGANDLEIPCRRHGQPGRLQRGFFVWNSDTGSKSFGLGTFLFDFMCANHIIWGASGFEEVRIRHTVSAPDRWLEEMVPALTQYANSETTSINKAIADAREKRLGDKRDDFLANRFGPRMVAKLNATHELEEERPIETVWDCTVAATAVARQMPWIGIRADLEREAGKLLVAA
jgi:hypothetical protein